MKDSGVEWLGMVPEHWEVQALQAIARVKSIPDQTDRELLSVYLDLGVIRFSDIKEKRTNATSEDLSKYQAVDPGDFVLNNQQAWRGSVGVSKYRGVVSPAYLVLSLSSRLKSEFANLLFRDRAMVSQYVIASKGVGSIQRNLYWPYLKRARTLIPPLPEQVAIVRYLDYVDVRVRRLTEAKRKLIGLLTEYKQAIIHRAVTHGLDPNVPLKDSGIEWLGMVPQHWEVRRVKTLFKEKDQRTDNGDGLLLSLTRSRGIMPHSEVSRRMASASDLSKYKICQPGDLVMNRMQAWSGMFAVSRLEGIISPDYSLFNPLDASEIEVDYFQYLFKTPVMVAQFAQRSKGIGMGFNRLYTPDFGNVRVALPPATEQVAIVEYLDRAAAEIDIAVARAKRQIELLNEYRTRLIADVVTGKLDVRDAVLDPEERDF